MQARTEPPAFEQHVHHHWHGVTAEDIAALLARQQPPGGQQTG